MELRPYQQAAVTAVYDHLRGRDDNPAVVLPTGSGKSLCIAQIVRDAVEQWRGRVLVVTHVKELVAQNAAKLRELAFGIPVGIYAAGLGSRDTDYAVTFASIQSIHQKADRFEPFDLVLIDECHLIPEDSDTMYRRFLADCLVINPHLRVVGFTATPYRMKSGPICTPEGTLNHVCFEASLKELIRDGYLAPLVTRAGASKADTSALHVRGGEFVAREAEAVMDETGLVRAACAEIVALTAQRKACLLFAAGRDHARHLQAELREEHGIAAPVIFGSTPNGERDRIVADFKAGRTKYLINVNVLTTGFDAPHVDAIALLRPTLSPGLYVQMVGRGFRRAPGKADCLVLDYGGNVLRHGPVDAVRVAADGRGSGSGEAPAKECPECQALIAAGFTTCPECGFAFPPPESPVHEDRAARAGILSGQHVDTEHRVRRITYFVHTKAGADEDAPKSMRVEYEIGFHTYQSEWICVEHTGFARRKAEAWWRKRTREPVPDTAAQAVAIADAGMLAEPSQITVRETAGEKFPRIIAYELGPVPEPREPGADEDEPAEIGAWLEEGDEVPF